MKAPFKLDLIYDYYLINPVQLSPFEFLDYHWNYSLMSESIYLYILLNACVYYYFPVLFAYEQMLSFNVGGLKSLCR